MVYDARDRFGSLIVVIAMTLLKRLLIPAAVLILAGGNLLLLAQNRQLKSSGARAATKDTEVLSGALLRGLGGVGTDGRFTSLPFGKDARQTLIFTYSALCNVCDRNQAFWLSLARTLSVSPHWRVVWISRDPLRMTQTFAANRAPAGLLLTEVSHRTYSQLAMELVPRTIAVDDKGVVAGVWVGALSPAQQDDVLQHTGTPRNALVEPSTEERSPK